eukprot:1554311-Amphidinium_carterae.1
MLAPRVLHSAQFGVVMDERSFPTLADIDCSDDAAREKTKRPDDYGVESMKITDDDAAFILGKGGKTKDARESM